MNARLKTDCSRCCALCCVVPPFDAEQGFGFDKPAHQPCRHLAGGLRCQIHDELVVRGFAGCAAFDCHGAGSWMIQSLFNGASWRSSPGTAQRMFKLYPRYRALHELMWLLETAIRHVPPTAAAPLRHCLDGIEALCQGSVETVERADVDGLRQEVRGLLRGLARPCGCGVPGTTVAQAK